MHRANSLVLCPAQFPFQREATSRISEDHGSAYRIAFIGALTAVALPNRSLSDLVQQHINLAHGKDRMLRTIAVYAEARKMTPMRVGELVLSSTQDLALHACHMLSRRYGVDAQYYPITREEVDEETGEIACFGCMDDRLFGRMGSFIQEQGGGSHFSWAGVITCPHANEFGVSCDQTQLLIRHLRMRNMRRVRRVYLMLHQDCAGHGGEQRLGSVGSQIDYFSKRLETERSRIQTALPNAEIAVHFAHIRSQGQEPAGVERIALWRPAA